MRPRFTHSNHADHENGQTRVTRERILWTIMALAVACALVLWLRSSDRFTRKESIAKDGVIFAPPTTEVAESDSAINPVPNFEIPPMVDPISDEQWLASTNPEQYTQSPARFSGYDLDMADGRFVARYFSDTWPKPHTTRGRYSIDKDRLTLRFLNSTEQRVLTILYIDGVKVLLMQEAAIDLHDERLPHSVVSREFHVLCPKAERDSNGRWWHDLLEAHPGFAKWCNP